MTRLATSFFLWFAAASLPAFAQEFDEKFEHWPIDLKINGNVIVSSNLEDTSILKDAVRRIDRTSEVALLLDADVDEAVAKEYCSLFDQGDNSVVVTKTGAFTSDQIRSLVEKYNLLCWHSSKAVTGELRTALMESRSALARHVASGGSIIAIGPHSGMFASLDITTDEARPHVTPGLGLIPDSVIETDYDNSPRDRNRLLSILAAHPRMVGIGLNKNTALLLSGRKLRVFGSGKATCLLMANERQPLRIESISASNSRRFSAANLADLTEWRRDAIDRTLAPFPPAEPQTPRVENGTLVIVGGGGLPDGLMSQFVELAGGRNAAKLVYVPCSERDELPENQSMVETWKRMGVKHATFVHTKDRNKANIDEEFLVPLSDATGIWFGGGRQWNFADSYYGTKAHKMMKAVVTRGGVVGGSSAGASIQARYLARATPIGNFRIMAPGYERGGLGFISGVAIDQHFSQRGRQKDMTRLVNRYPQLLGIGIDERTALIVNGSIAEVVGQGKVHFYDRNQPVYPNKPDYTALASGSTYDLAARKVINES